MPQLVIQTNLRLAQIPADFNEKTTELLATIQSKPPSMTLISVLPNQLITFGGSHEPCALVHYQSIGNVSPAENRESCVRIFKHLETELGISPKRVFIDYFNLEPSNVAWNGHTYQDIFAGDVGDDLDPDPPVMDDDDVIKVADVAQQIRQATPEIKETPPEDQDGGAVDGS